MTSRGRGRSCPPCTEHDPSSAVDLPNGVSFMMRCAQRELCYNDLHTREDRGYEWALTERDRSLPQISLPLKESILCNGWACECGTGLQIDARFCWRCGRAKSSRLSRELDQPQYLNLCTSNPQPGEPMYLSSNSLRFVKPPSASKASIQDRGARKRKDSLRSSLSRTPLPCVLEQDETTYAASTTDSAPSTSEVGISNRSTESSFGWSKEAITTMMICSLPYDVTSELLLQTIDCAGFAGLYDFVYLPSRSIKKWKSRGNVANPRDGNVGYAFVNFRDPEDASRFESVFAGISIPGVASDKEITVTQAVCQGYEANLAMHVGKKNRQGSLMTFGVDQDTSFGA